MLKYIIAIMVITSLTLNAAEGAKHQRPWDTDGDKGLNKTEWLARASARFEMFDINKDGIVTIAEAKAGREVCEKKREERKQEHKK